MPDPDLNELQRKAALAKSILDDVVESSSHEDEKVGRILYSMSFLTVGATIAFSTFLANRIGNLWYEVNLTSVLFVVYLALLVVGTVIILESMSPRFHIRQRKSLQRSKDGYIASSDLQSMHFFKSIARMDVENWVKSFKEVGSAELYEKECEDALRQAHFLSRKVSEKIEYIRMAKWVMLLASVSLVLMVLVGVASYL